MRSGGVAGVTFLAAGTFLLVVAAGCPSPQPVAPGVGDASGDACQAACAQLDAIGCGLGDGGGSCAAFMSTVETQKALPNQSTQKPLTCVDVVAVRTKDDARKLGFVCP